MNGMCLSSNNVMHVNGSCRFLQILLFEAERCWAYAMDLKQHINTEPRKRFHLIKRLKRAVQAANKLQEVSKSLDIDAITAQEIEVLITKAHLFDDSWILGVFTLPASHVDS